MRKIDESVFFSNLIKKKTQRLKDIIKHYTIFKYNYVFVKAKSQLRD